MLKHDTSVMATSILGAGRYLSCLAMMLSVYTHDAGDLSPNLTRPSAASLHLHSTELSDVTLISLDVRWSAKGIRNPYQWIERRCGGQVGLPSRCGPGVHEFAAYCYHLIAGLMAKEIRLRYTEPPSTTTFMYKTGCAIFA